jgi:predicted RNA-binding protein
VTVAADALLVYVGQQVIDRETTLPPAITGCFEIVSDVYEDTERIVASPPNVGRGRGRGQGDGGRGLSPAGTAPWG